MTKLNGNDFNTKDMQNVIKDIGIKLFKTMIVGTNILELNPESREVFECLGRFRGGVEGVIGKSIRQAGGTFNSCTYANGLVTIEV